MATVPYGEHLRPKGISGETPISFLNRKWHTSNNSALVSFKTIKGEGAKHIKQHIGHRVKLLYRDLERKFLNVMLSDSGQCSERARAAVCYMLNVTGGHRMTDGFKERVFTWAATSPAYD